eukprot:GHVU01182606.1.p2 GENE.GHVU01182606.1~~GHVU01182606.1.p2  ORF type:complete len:102 (+),score=12.64 GHVU01182606.1:32-307(+)
MAEAALRDDGRTPAQRAHTMVQAAERMGQAARRAEATGKVIKWMYTDGATYRGDVMNGRPHGLGVKRRAGRSVAFEGEWRNGKVHGLGVRR